MIEIIGNGDIAGALKRAASSEMGLMDDRLYFASGVSNPNETSKSEFQREKDLLRKQRKDLQVVYISTQGVNNPNKTYFFHKIAMEELVKSLFPHYVIARIGIITWGTNPITTINFLRRKLERGEPFKIRDVIRDVVDEEEFIRQINLLPRENCVIEIHGQVMTEEEIFKKYVHDNKHK